MKIIQDMHEQLDTIQHNAVLTAQEITKIFEGSQSFEILKGISLALEPSKMVAILGRSGEGKSTLLHILGLLEDPTSGTIEIQGVQAQGSTNDSLRNRHIGFVFQAFHLLEDATVLENVLLPPQIARISTKRGSPAFERACYLLAEVGLKDRLHQLVSQLSGGEKQRVAMARALINNPSIILADEPTGNLDSHTATQIHHLLRQCAHKEGKAVLVVTHDLELARLADTCYRLENGKISSISNI